MDCNEFNQFSKFGTHWYITSYKKFTFNEADKYARENGGHLAVPETASENSFLSSLITRDAAWIGVYDPSFVSSICNVDTSKCMVSDLRYRTIFKTSLLYSNWKLGEPNNAVYNSDYNSHDGTPLVDPLGEYWTIMLNGGKWIDTGNHIFENAEKNRFQALLEFDSMPPCVVGDATDATEVEKVSGDNFICDSQIYYSNSSDVPATRNNHAFCELSDDEFPYCPIELNACALRWDYFKNDGNHTNPKCRDGEYDKEIKKCKKEKYVCTFDETIACLDVNGIPSCSPHPCFDESSVEKDDTPTGINDKKNNGWKDDGSCGGKIYFFNGKDRRCRSKMLYGLVNNCCTHDSFLFGMADCKEYEVQLDREKEEDKCVYIGEYCSDRVFGACIKKKQSYCCFNSVLAKTIIVEGRKQFKKEIGWGSTKNPNCRGFTPTEFEKIDFSKIDLTPFTESLTSEIDESNINEKKNRIKNRIGKH